MSVKMALLKGLTKKTILEEVIRGTELTKKPGEIDWRVLVVDQLSMRVISACLSMNDIAAEGITIVEDISKNREPLPFLEAIYFISPSEESMKILLKDLSSSSMYRGYHIFFTESCNEKLFNELCQSPHNKKIKSLKEINISFLPYESHVFSMDCPKAMQHFYNPQASDDSSASDSMEKIASQIATLCATLGEYPAVRYRGAFNKNNELAQIVEEKLKEYKSNENTMGEGPEKARSQLIILDRGFDCVTPLVHELTFQAMAYDLLNIENNVYRYEVAGGQEKEILLDDTDEKWLEVRHLHIADVSKIVPQNLKKFMDSKDKNARSDKSNAKDLAVMIKKMPQHQKELTNLTSHITLAEDCMKNMTRIKKLCEVEQNLAMGVNTDGEKIRDHMSQMNPILLDLDNVNGVSSYEKVRLILLYIISKNGISEDSLNKVIQHASIDENLRSTIINMSLLGLNVVVNGNNRREIHQIERKERLEQKYTLSRWTPVVKDIMEYTIDDRLDQRSFPFIGGRAAVTGYKPPTSTRYGQWHQKPGQAVKNVPRLIIFIVGGVTFSEMRSAYEVTAAQNDWEVVIGSTHILVPKIFLENLKNLTKAEE